MRYYLLLIILVFGAQAQVRIPGPGGAAGAALGPIAFVANAQGATWTGLGAATTVHSGTMNNTGANFLVLSVSTFGGTVSGCADSSSNTWVSRPAVVHADTNTTVQMFYVANATVSASQTVTCTNNFPNIFVASFSNVVSSPFDLETNAQGGSSTLTVGPLTPSVNNEVVVVGLINSSVSGTYGISAPYTITDQQNTIAGQSMGGALAYSVQTTATATTPQWSNLGATNSVTTIAAFK